MGESRSFGAPGHIRRCSRRFAGTYALEEALQFSAEPGLHPVRIVDCGDIRGDPLDLRGTVERATAAVRTLLDRGAVPIVLGGDDAISIPVVRAYADHGPLVVVQLDEHFDFGDEVNGNREGYCSPIRRVSEMPWVAAIAQIGLQAAPAGWMPVAEGVPYGGRALVEEQGLDGWRIPAALRDAGNTLVSAREVHEQGVAAVLARIPSGADYFVTLDVDAFDAAVCPAVSHPEPGGLTYWEVVGLFRGLAARGRIVGMDLTEMVPEHDIHDLGGRTAARLILSTIAGMAASGQFSK